MKTKGSFYFQNYVCIYSNIKMSPLRQASVISSMAEAQRPMAWMVAATQGLSWLVM
jgi:hypothetical protein